MLLLHPQTCNAKKKNPHMLACNPAAHRDTPSLDPNKPPRARAAKYHMRVRIGTD
jgi:hypothetical protein